MIILWIENNFNYIRNIKLRKGQLILFFSLAMFLQEIFISSPEILGKKGGFGYGNIVALGLSPILGAIELAICSSLIFILIKIFDENVKYRDILYIYPFIQLVRIPFFFIACSTSLIPWAIRFIIIIIGLSVCTLIMVIAFKKILKINLLSSITSSLGNLIFLIFVIYVYKICILPKIAKVVNILGWLNVTCYEPN